MERKMVKWYSDRGFLGNKKDKTPQSYSHRSFGATKENKHPNNFSRRSFKRGKKEDENDAKGRTLLDGTIKQIISILNNSKYNNITICNLFLLCCYVMFVLLFKRHIQKKPLILIMQPQMKHPQVSVSMVVILYWLKTY